MPVLRSKSLAFQTLKVRVWGRFFENAHILPYCGQNFKFSKKGTRAVLLGLGAKPLSGARPGARPSERFKQLQRLRPNWETCNARMFAFVYV